MRHSMKPDLRADYKIRLYTGPQTPFFEVSIFWRLRCGAPWRDVPPKYGNWNTIYRRFRRWNEAGIWEIVSVTLAEIMADSGHYSIDSTTVRAHVLAAGGKGGSSTRSWSLAGRVHQ